MTKMKRKINSTLRGITELEFKISCKAWSNGYGAPVKLKVGGLEDEKANKGILEQIKEVAIMDTVRNMDPAKITDSLDATEYPLPCKAWAAVALWFAFAMDAPEEYTQAWREFYAVWNGRFDRLYDDAVLRDALLAELGMNERWIARRVPSRKRLDAYCVGVEPGGGAK